MKYNELNVKNVYKAAVICSNLHLNICLQYLIDESSFANTCFLLRTEKNKLLQSFYLKRNLL
jgi:hypothetical protein